MLGSSPFRGFFMGGFECASHRRRDGRRLDLTASTGHDRNAAADYRQLADAGLLTARDGFRWHLIEATPGRYDWAAALPLVRAARRAGVQVIWDLTHYGYPDHLDIWSARFPRAFARYARAAARFLRDETDEAPLICPINEISFWSWAGGDVSYINPCANGRGFELKAQLCRASIAAMEAMRDESPHVRFIHAEPVINIAGNPAIPGSVEGAAEAYRLAQFQAWDMIAGTVWPQLGGRPEFLDIIGLNYYPKNQWVDGGETVGPSHPGYKPLQDMIMEIWERYRRPLFIAETGAEDNARGPWLETVAREVREARARGAPVSGLCLYPILDHPGWDDDRPCPCGLFGADPGEAGERAMHAPLAAALARAVASVQDGPIAAVPCSAAA